MRVGSVDLIECDWQKASNLRLQGLTVKQIAGRFGVSVSAIKRGLAKRSEKRLPSKTSSAIPG
jgi:transposase